MSSSSKRTLELSGKRRAILEALLREQGVGAMKAERIPRREVAGPAPLSFAQQRLWFLNQLEPDSPVYNNPAALRLTGMLDVKALEESFSEIIRRHEALRTTYRAVGWEAVQIIHRPQSLSLPVVDLIEL